MSDNYSARKGKTFFGHPIQLSTLFHIELWERFSFYGMQGILLIYLYYTADKGGLGMDKSLAGGIVGAYGGSVYLSTILGAWLADRIWGAEKRCLFPASWSCSDTSFWQSHRVSTGCCAAWCSSRWAAAA